MKYTILRNTELKVSNIAFGTARLGTKFDLEESFSFLDYYAEQGGNVIDTAHVYGNWIPDSDSPSEKVIGLWLNDRNNRKDIIISTKGGHPEPPNKDVSRLSRADILSDIDKSLINLKTDYVDIFWIHKDDVNQGVPEVLDTLEQIIKTGKARYVGISNWKSDRLGKAIEYSSEKEYSPILLSQIQCNIAKANPEGVIDPHSVIMDEVEYAFYKNRGLSVFAFTSQVNGFFQKIDGGGEKALSETVKKMYLNDTNMETYKRIKKVSDKTGYNVGDIVLSALIGNKDFTIIPIIGSSSVSQLKESMAAAEATLEQSDIDYIVRWQ